MDKQKIGCFKISATWHFEVVLKQTHIDLKVSFSEIKKYIQPGILLHNQHLRSVILL